MSSLPSIHRRKLTWSLGLFCAALLVIVYILQLNSLTALAYHIADHEEQLQQMKDEYTDLQIGMQGSASLQDLETLALQLHFERITSISYLRVPGGSVAQSDQ